MPETERDVPPWGWMTFLMIALNHYEIAFVFFVLWIFRVDTSV